MIRTLYIDDEANTEKMRSKFEILEDNGISIKPEFSIVNIKYRLDSLIKDIDLVIVDLIMPPRDEFNKEETNGGSLTGAAVIKEIRKIDNKIPIIIVSILKKDNLVSRFLETYKVADFIDKSSSTDDLILKIKSIFQ